MRFVLINAGLHQELFTSGSMDADEVVQKARTVLTSSPIILQTVREWVSDPKGGTLLRVSRDAVLARLQDESKP